MNVFVIPWVPLELLTPEVDVDKRAIDEVNDDAEEDRDEVLDEGLLQSIYTSGVHVEPALPLFHLNTEIQSEYRNI